MKIRELGEKLGIICVVLLVGLVIYSDTEPTDEASMEAKYEYEQQMEEEERQDYIEEMEYQEKLDQSEAEQAELEHKLDNMSEEELSNYRRELSGSEESSNYRPKLNEGDVLFLLKGYYYHSDPNCEGIRDCYDVKVGNVNRVINELGLKACNWCN